MGWNITLRLQLRDKLSAGYHWMMNWNQPFVNVIHVHCCNATAPSPQGIEKFWYILLTSSYEAYIQGKPVFLIFEINSLLSIENFSFI